MGPVNPNSQLERGVLAVVVALIVCIFLAFNVAKAVPGESRLMLQPGEILSLAELERRAAEAEAAYAHFREEQRRKGFGVVFLGRIGSDFIYVGSLTLLLAILYFRAYSIKALLLLALPTGVTGAFLSLFVLLS